MAIKDGPSIKSESSIYFTFVDSGAHDSQPQIAWAVGELENRLGEKSVALRSSEYTEDSRRVEAELLLAYCDGPAVRRHCDSCGVTRPTTPESFVIFCGRGRDANRIFVFGFDSRGLIYAIMELADRVRLMPDLVEALAFPNPSLEKPTAPVRGISKCFQCEDEDLPWFHDREGWKAYFTELITHRFNRFALTFGMQYNYPYGNEFLSDVYFYLAYPFLVSVPGHDVTITNLTNAERHRNLETLKFIAKEADRRGLEFQLALWTQSYDFDDCPNAKHQISGLGPANIAAYCRDALAAILEEVPEITGLTLRVHVECGIPEGNYDFWRTYFEAVKSTGRAIRLDLHAKGLEERLIKIALETGMPVNVSPKYTSEHLGLPYHQASIRALERPPRDGESAAGDVGRHLQTLYTGRDATTHADKWKFSEGSRKFMRYSYGDLMREDRPYGILYRIWPGTIRILLWGDPALSAGYGRHSILCGSQGVELCEPLSFKGRMGSGGARDRTGYQEKYLIHRHDWQKFEYTYRTWGRSLYDPEADPAAFRRYLAFMYGSAAESCGSALASASRILPLITLVHTPTASNNSYWPEMYENMSIVHEAPHLPYGYELFKPARFGTVGSCDPQLFMAPSDFAACIHSGENARRIAPLTWANWLERHATTADLEMARALAAAGNPETNLHLVSVDVTILSAIGRFFANKVRAAVFWEYYLLSSEIRSAEEAVDHYHRARDAWAEAAAICQDVYLPDITYGPHSWLRGRWDDRLPAIEQDILDMEAIVEKDRQAGTQSTHVGELKVDRIRTWSASQMHACHHSTRGTFVRGREIEIRVRPFGASRLPVTLHYRHADQSKPWRQAGMIWRGGEYVASIPSDYTDTVFPLLYYFEIGGDGCSSIYPGLVGNLSNSPYLLLSSVSPAREPVKQA